MRHLVVFSPLGSPLPAVGYPFNWIDSVMQEVVEKVGKLASSEAAQGCTV
jgi:hypothetical protein